MMDKLYQYFYNLQGLLPYITIFFIILGIFVLIGILVLIVLLVRSSTRKKPPPKPVPLSKSTAEEKAPPKSVFGVEEESIFYRNSWSAKWLARLGFYPKGKMASSFVQAMQLLRDQVGGNQYLYKLPWYLMLGPANSGKSTLLKYVDLATPVGKPNFYAQGEKPGCDWSFFADSVILDVQGDYFLEEKDTESNQDMWQHLLTLLSRFRPKRPIDGIILTIPSTELIGDNKLDANMLAERAQYVQQKLAILSTRMGMRISIYIVITKADYIPGFKSFANETPKELHQDIFGWSCPYPVEEAYTPSWIDDAYSDLQDGLESVQNEIFAHGETTDEADGVFLFPSMVQQTKETLRVYTDNIFKGTGYQNFYFLRGIYFCGDAEITYSANKVSGLAVDFGSIIQHLGEAQTLIGNPSKQQPNILFTKRLLQDKIFKEYGLTRPDSRRLHSSNRQINILKFALVSTVIVGTIGINKAHERVRRLATEITTFAVGVEGGITRLTALEKNNSSIPPDFFEEKLKLSISMAHVLPHTTLRSFFLPASWYKGLETRSANLLPETFDYIILKALRLQLMYNVDLVINENAQTDYQETEGVYITPTKTVEFVILSDFVNKLITLEHATTKYNKLKSTHNLDDFADVVKAAFGYGLGTSLTPDAAVFRDVLLNSKIDPIALLSIGEIKNSQNIAAQTKFLSLFDNFTKRVFSTESTFKGIQSLELMIHAFVNSRYKNLPSLSSLQAIAQGLKSTVELINSPGLNWLDNTSFSPQTYQDLLAAVESSTIFGTDFVAKVNTRADNAFADLKEELKKFDSPLTGKLFATKGNDLLSQASEGLKNLNDLLGEFITQSFMGQVAHYEFTPKVPAGSTLLWNQKGIERAVILTEDFIKYTNERLSLYPENLQHILKLMAREQLRESVMSLVAVSQTFVDNPIGDSRFINEEVMRNQTRNLKTVTPRFIQLLRALDKAGSVDAYLSIRDLLLNQTFSLLSVADGVLNAENLYSFKDDNFDWWQGQTQSANTAFNVADKDAMRNYLESQRDRVLFLADTFVRPIMALYGNDVFRMGKIDAPLLDKWLRLLQQSNDYQDKKPNTTISTLHKFVGEKMNMIGWNNCLAELTADLSQSDGDFFLHKLNRVKVSMLDRCRVILGEKIFDQYTQMHDFFEANLAGRFPFIDDPQAFSYGEANLRDVKAFFQMFDQYRDSTREVLEQSSAFGQEGQDVLRFIQDMTAVQVFMKPFTDAANEKKPGFDFDVEFRVNRESEFGANRIADWTFFSGSQSVNYRDDKKQGRWEFGIPVAIQLRWAKDSPEIPVSDPAQKALNVAGSVATFGYGGQWGLLRLFMNHATSSADMVTANDIRPEILTLNVPVRPRPSTDLAPTDPDALTRFSKVFMRIIPVVRAGDGGKSSAVSVPFFPAKAPHLKKPESPIQVYFSDIINNGALKDDSIVGAGKVGAPVPLAQEDSFQEAIDMEKKPTEKSKESSEQPVVPPKKGKKS